jgi:Holliday junction resolvasome RuvABC DNA-binding subunit
MGFKPAEAERAISALADRLDREGESFESLLREALASLAK